jgi:hypothetical protein
MDVHPAGGTALTTIKRMIDECDYYVVLLGSRYGTLSASGVSFTHVEYVYASTKQKPILVRMHDAPETRPADFQERTPEGRLKFNDFRQMLMKGMTARWTALKDLETAIRQYLPMLVKTRPMPGWVKAGNMASPDQEKELAALRSRIQELEMECDELLNKQVQAQGALSQGQDLFELSYRCKAYALGNCEDVNVKSFLSWNDIFASFAPYLNQPQTEEFLLAKINERVQASALPDVQKLRAKAHAVTDVQLAPFTINTLKVQFRTLGLVRRVPKPGDSRQWWQLTTAGEHHLTSLMVIRKRVAQSS